MKYPVLTLPELPWGYKHCEKVVMIHFNFQNEEGFIQEGDVEVKKAYMVSLKKEIGKLMDDLLILARPGVAEVNDETFVVFKDNVDMYKLHDTAQKILAEALYFTKNKVDIKYVVVPTMIMKDGADPTFFSANKVGDPVLNSKEYEKNVHASNRAMDLKELSFTTPYIEFKNAYQK